MHAELDSIAREIRADIVRMSAAARVPHVASALSCADILVALYFSEARLFPREPEHPDRDRIILSKGHASAALYACLARRGFFPPQRLGEYGGEGSLMGEHPTRGTLPGIDVTTGSLGNGLGTGSGIAYAAKLDGRPSRVFVILSDGECNEGAVWEAALWAPVQSLHNLVAIVDFNGIQATGFSRQITALEPLAAKWAAFGWDVSEVNGHSLSELVAALRKPPAGPRAIIANTTKGKGVGFMENDVEWHYKFPNAAELELALAEIAEPRR